MTDITDQYNLIMAEIKQLKHCIAEAPNRNIEIQLHNCTFNINYNNNSNSKSADRKTKSPKIILNYGDKYPSDSDSSLLESLDNDTSSQSSNKTDENLLTPKQLLEKLLEHFDEKVIDGKCSCGAKRDPRAKPFSKEKPQYFKQHITKHKDNPEHCDFYQNYILPYSTANT